MEFVEGVPLAKMIEQAGSLPALRVADIVRQAGDALAVRARAWAIVHRDLKPDNIMIAKRATDAICVKVVDFGIAEGSEGDGAQKLTQDGTGHRHAGVHEPRAARRRPARRPERHLLAGAGRFQHAHVRAAIPGRVGAGVDDHATDRPAAKALGEMRPDVAWPAGVQAVMDRALERDATQRYQTAAEFGRDLHRAISRMPETAAAAMGTEVIGIPPTRVAPPGPPVDGGAARGNALLDSGRLGAGNSARTAGACRADGRAAAQVFRPRVGGNGDDRDRSRGDDHDHEAQWEGGEDRCAGDCKSDAAE